MLLSVSAESAERQAMDILSVSVHFAEYEGMRDAERQTKPMLSVSVHGTGRSEDRM